MNVKSLYSLASQFHKLAVETPYYRKLRLLKEANSMLNMASAQLENFIRRTKNVKSYPDVLNSLIEIQATAMLRVRILEQVIAQHQAFNSQELQSSYQGTENEVQILLELISWSELNKALSIGSLNAIKSKIDESKNINATAPTNAKPFPY